MSTPATSASGRVDPSIGDIDVVAETPAGEKASPSPPTPPPAQTKPQGRGWHRWVLLLCGIILILGWWRGLPMGMIYLTGLVTALMLSFTIKRSVGLIGLVVVLVLALPLGYLFSQEAFGYAELRWAMNHITATFVVLAWLGAIGLGWGICFALAPAFGWLGQLPWFKKK